MPELKLSITLKPSKELTAGFERMKNIIHDNKAFRAAISNAVKSFLNLEKCATSGFSSIVQGYLRKAESYCPNVSLKPIVFPAEHSTFQDFNSIKELVNNLAEIGRRLNDSIAESYPVDDFRGGQGVVFSAISQWFFSCRMRRDSRKNQIQFRPGYYPGWSRGRTAKSLKAPMRFKGWKGGRS